MKKILAITLLAISLGSSAFWNNNNGYGNYNNYNNYNGYDDNGMFGYNPYDFWDPRWYMEEMENMFDEFDNNGWDNNYGPYNYGRNGYGFAPGEYMNTPWGPSTIRTPAPQTEVSK